MVPAGEITQERFETFRRGKNCVMEQERILQCVNSLETAQSSRTRTRGFVTADMFSTVHTRTDCAASSWNVAIVAQASV